jgi:flagellar biosynthesis chaperone FliJ
MKKKAEAALARAIIALRQAREKLDELKEEKEKIIERFKQARVEMKRSMDFGGQVGVGNRHVNFMRKLKEDEEKKQEEIEDQELVIEDLEAKVALARREYIESAKQLRIMDKHKELWHKKIRAEISKKEAKEMDELGATIHQLRKWRGEKSISES